MQASFPLPGMLLDQIIVSLKYLLFGFARFFGFVELGKDLHGLAVRLVIGVDEAGGIFRGHCVKESVADDFLF